MKSDYALKSWTALKLLHDSFGGALQGVCKMGWSKTSMQSTQPMPSWIREQCMTDEEDELGKRYLEPNMLSKGLIFGVSAKQACR